MLFMRPATKEDFQGYQVQYDHFSYMNDEVKKLIEEGHFNSAVATFRKQTGLGVVQVKGYCEEYQRYAKAKHDFENGKPVFVSY